MSNEVIAVRSATVSRSLALASGANAALANHNIDQALSLAIAANQIEVVSLAFNPDGRSILSGSIDTTVRLWDISTGKLIHRLDGHASGVMSGAFSPHGRFAVTGSQDGTLIVWDLEDGALLRQIKAHEGVVHSVAFTLDGEGIWSASEDGLIKLWNPILSLDDLFSWIRKNRFVPELDCDQRLLYGLESTCRK